MGGELGKVSAYFHEDALIPKIEKAAEKVVEKVEHTRFDAPTEHISKVKELAGTESRVHLTPYLLEKPEAAKALDAAKAADSSIYIG